MSITAGSGVEVMVIDTPALGDRSYLAHDGATALVVDPQRDIDRVLALAAAHGGPAAWAAGQSLRSYPVADFAGLALVRRHRPVTVLDVRRDSEWDAAHIDGALHVPLHDLASRIGELPGGELWVHCQGGYRASVAASFLDAAGQTVVAVDDDFGRAAEAGLPVVIPAPVPQEGAHVTSSAKPGREPVGTRRLPRRRRSPQPDGTGLSLISGSAPAARQVGGRVSGSPGYP